MSKPRNYGACQGCGGTLDERGPDICPTGGHCPRALPETTETQVGAPLHGPKSDAQTIEWLQKRVKELEHKLDWAGTEHAKLQEVYNKLADQWNVFQATNRPDNRNIQRAEGAGEMARKLAEVLLGVAYERDVRDLLQKILNDMEDAGGREVEEGQTQIRLAVLIRSPRGGDDSPQVGLLTGRSRAAQRERHDPRLAAVLERGHVDRSGLDERLSDHVRAAELVGNARGSQEPGATPAAVRAQHGRPLERGDRDRECAAPDRTFGRLVE